MSKAGLWIKMIAAGGILSIGGPFLIYWVTPAEEELIKRYNPDLQRRSLENRQGKQQDFDSFVAKLKDYSRSDKPVWDVAADDEARTRANAVQEQRRVAEEMQKRREEIKRHSISGR